MGCCSCSIKVNDKTLRQRIIEEQQQKILSETNKQILEEQQQEYLLNYYQDMQGDILESIVEENSDQIQVSKQQISSMDLSDNSKFYQTLKIYNMQNNYDQENQNQAQYLLPLIKEKTFKPINYTQNHLSQLDASLDSNKKNKKVLKQCKSYQDILSYYPDYFVEKIKQSTKSQRKCLVLINKKTNQRFNLYIQLISQLLF